MSNNIIYVGKKPLLNYCQAIIQTLHDNDTAKLLARGSAISRAVDAVEVTRNRYLNGVEIKSIEIGTDELESSDGEMRNVSNMTIILEKNDQ
ncbi:DNA-binding protein Alba [Candidatus Bathyarchaeota archaeon]|nr:DNA-binding protein Alba [Candidatus Bathyarchaeota archaeon]